MAQLLVLEVPIYALSICPWQWIQPVPLTRGSGIGGWRSGNGGAGAWLG